VLKNTGHSLRLRLIIIIIIIIIGMIGHLDAIPERASSVPWTGGGGWTLEVVWK